MSAQVTAKARRGGSGDERRALVYLVTPLLIWLLLFLVVPLLVMFLYSITRESGMTLAAGGWSPANYVRVLQVPIYRTVIGRSLRTGLEATLITLLVGYLPAYYMSRCSPRLRTLLLLMLVVPFWTPYIIRVFAWMLILSTHGLLNLVLTRLGLAGVDILYKHGAVLIGLVYSGLPFMVLPIYAALSKIDPRLYEAAMNLGATERHAFWEITVPLSLPGVWAGSVMTFILAAGSYLAPAILGGPDQIMMSQLIASRFLDMLDWPLGAALSGVYLLITLIVVTAANQVITLQGAFQTK